MKIKPSSIKLDHIFLTQVSSESSKSTSKYANNTGEFNFGSVSLNHPFMNSVDSIEPNKFHVREFSKGEFLYELKEYFDDVTLYSQKLIIRPPLKEKILKSASTFTIKLANKYDVYNFRRKFFKSGFGEQQYKNIDSLYHPSTIIKYEKNHSPQNFIAVCLSKK